MYERPSADLGFAFVHDETEEAHGDVEEKTVDVAFEGGGTITGSRGVDYDEWSRGGGSG